MTHDEHWFKKIDARIDELVINMQKMGVAEYVEMLHNPRRLLYSNFLAGVARGAGISVGFALIGALAAYILSRVVALNLPLISDFLADVVQMVRERSYY